MTYALLVSVLCGVTGFLEPLDDFARSIRYSLRYVKADGSIVVIGIDQKSARELGGKFPWPRAVDAALIEKLKQSGVKKVVFDQSFSNTDTPQNTSTFIRTLDRYRGSIFFGSGVLSTRSGAISTALFPAPEYIPHVDIGTFVHRSNAIGQPARLYTTSPLHPGRFPGISVILSGGPVPSAKLYRPDFAIRRDSFPTYSYSDVLLGRVDAARLANRDVVIGLNEDAFGDTNNYPGQGRMPGVFAHAMGAQTLKTGVPVELGWLPGLFAALVGAVALLRTHRIVSTALTLSSIATVLVGVPFLLDSALITVEVAPAVLLIGMVTIQHARLTFGRLKSRIFEPTGLPNIVALRELGSEDSGALIAARIANHAAIAASFVKDIEFVISSEIVSRLKIGDPSTQVFQGDEGVYYMISSIVDRELLSEHLDGLHALFSQPVRIGDRYVDIAISFGVDDQRSRAMTSRIGAALMSAESARRDGLRWKFYDDPGNSDAAWQLSIGGEIDRAITEGQFWLAYQPKLDLRTGDIVGAETLVRWSHPVRGPIAPVEFIPAAERDHRIDTITRFVLEQAVIDMVSLPESQRLTIAVNISVPILRQPAFSAYVRQLVEDAELKPSNFTIEITESVFLSVDDTNIMSNLAALAEAGFGISIDDFGTGFSTLETLQRVPATEVKIDQTFIKSLTVRTADTIIVSSIIKMAKGLNRRVVAEGIEDAATLQQLSAMGCDQGQGFHIGRPERFEAFAALVSQLKAQRAA